MADRTHLHRAAQRGDIGAVRALVQAVDVNLRGGWRVESPLHAASRSGRPDVIACLVDAGAHTEVRDRNNDTPLLLAAWLGHAAAISKLLASGARVDADGIPRSALHCACMQGHAGCVSELLRGGADENVEDEDGNTPAEVIGTMSESLERAEDVALIREMLRRAPADRSWRRRGWLVILRARDCAAAGLLALPPLPIAVTTRSSAKRGVGVSDSRVGDVGGGGRIVAGPVSPRSLEGQGLTIGDQQQEQKGKVVGTRGKNQGTRQVSVTGDRRGDRDASPKRSSAVGGSGESLPGIEKRFHKKGGRVPAKGRGRKGGRRRGRGNARNDSEKTVANGKVLADLVARLIALGEEGAFRCVLSFL